MKFWFFKVLAMEESQENIDLGASFRQSRSEFWVMIATWIGFAAWTLTYNGLFGKGEEGTAVEIVLGMPKWVVFGIAVPWVLAVSVTVWFALCFMKDTPLGDDQGGETGTKEEGAE